LCGEEGRRKLGETQESGQKPGEKGGGKKRWKRRSGPFVTTMMKKWGPK